MPSPSPPTASSAPVGSSPASWGPLLRRRLLLFASLAVAGCAADLLSKELVFQWRGMPRPRNEWWVPGLKGYVGVETSLNDGALFGGFQGYGKVFAAISIAAAAGIVYWLFWAGAGRDWGLTLALGLVTGGIFGNLYDRLGFWQDPERGAWRDEVRDWILLRYGSYSWPNFNIADSLLVCGAVLLAWQALRAPHAEADADGGGKQLAKADA